MSAQTSKPWMLPFGLGVVAGSVMGLGLFVVLNRAEAIRGKRPPSADPEAEIRAVLDAQAEAWNRGDLDGFMAGYWEGDDLRFASGDKVTTGYAATKQKYADTYQKPGAEMGKLTFSEVTVEMVSPELAVVRGRWKLDLTKPTDGPDHGLYTLTVRKTGVGWKVTSDHTSAPWKKEK